MALAEAREAFEEREGWLINAAMVLSAVHLPPEQQAHLVRVTYHQIMASVVRDLIYSNLSRKVSA